MQRLLFLEMLGRAASELQIELPLSGDILIRRADEQTNEIVCFSPKPGILEVQVPCSLVSRPHALLHVEDGAVSIEDLGSKNGTLLPIGEHVRQPFETRAVLGEELQIRLGAARPTDHTGAAPRSPNELLRRLKEALRGTQCDVLLNAADGSETRRRPQGSQVFPIRDGGSIVLVFQGTVVAGIVPRVRDIVNEYNLETEAPATDWRFLAKSPERKAALRLAQQVAPTNYPVLVLGPHGIGKEVLVEDIHRHSGRAGKPFIQLNCAAIQNSLFESELFGSTKGAYTSAVDRRGFVSLAKGGTLFLDEVGELSLENQAKLLTFLSSGNYANVGGAMHRDADVRVIAATNRDLQAKMNEGTFREDLFHRMATVVIEIPPLDGVDSTAIARTLAKSSVAAFSSSLSSDEVEELAELAGRVSWKGSVRDLNNVIKRYLMFRGQGRSVADTWTRALTEGVLRANNEVADPPDLENLDFDLSDVGRLIGRLLFLAAAQRSTSWAAVGRRMHLTKARANEKAHDYGVHGDIGNRQAIEQAMGECRTELGPLLPLLAQLLKAP